MISVCLCTYNGARFLSEQLGSIAQQTLVPGELVVSDDGSTDGTLDIVRQFAARAAFPVRVEVNSRNLGSTANFSRAIGLCQGELIALCDQDDVWLPHKLERLVEPFQHASTGLVFSDATLVDAELRPMGYGLWDSLRFTPAERERFRQGAAYDCLLRRYRVTGATLAFRSCFRELVLPVPGAWIHDAWLALLISAVAEVVPVDEPLILYRQHAGQQIGEKKRSLYQEYLAARAMAAASFRETLERFELARGRLEKAGQVSPERLAALGAKIEHCRVRVRMREAGVWRWPLICREAWQGNYGRFSYGWKALAQDLFLP